MTAKKMFSLGFHSFAEFNVYLTFVLLGMSIMLVVSAITSAPNFVTEFYKYATGVPDAEPEKPYFWSNANTFYNVGTYGAQIICEPLALLPFVRRIPLQVRLFTGLGIMLVEMLLLIVIPSATISSQDGAIALIMVVSIMGGFSKGLVDSTTNALLGPYPTKFLNGELWGLAVISLVMSVIQCILQATMDTDFTGGLNQSRIYIGIGMGIQVLAIVELAILPLNPFAQKYTAEYRMKALARAGQLPAEDGELSQIEGRRGSNEPTTGELNGPVDGNLMLDETAGDVHHSKHDPLDAPQDEDVVAAVSQSDEINNSDAPATTNFLNIKGDADKMQDLDQNGQLTSSDQLLRTDALKVFRHVWPMLICVFIVFFTSLLIFPGVFFKVPSNNSWYFTIIVLLFNAGDFVARIILMIRPLRPPPKVVIIGTVARLAIIPLLVVSARGYIKGEALPYVLVTLLGLTNGVFGAQAMIHCPRTPTLSMAGERSIAAQWAGVALMGGLACGSFLALAITLTWKPIE